jgi:hypothetical protein
MSEALASPTVTVLPFPPAPISSTAITISRKVENGQVVTRYVRVSDGSEVGLPATYHHLSDPAAFVPPPS